MEVLGSKPFVLSYLRSNSTSRSKQMAYWMGGGPGMTLREAVSRRSKPAPSMPEHKNPVTRRRATAPPRNRLEPNRPHQPAGTLPLSSAEATKYRELIDRRKRQRADPIHHRRARVLRTDLQCRPRTSSSPVPRPSTWSRQRSNESRRNAPVRIADVGTGSGAIAVALAVATTAGKVHRA